MRNLWNHIAVLCTMNVEIAPFVREIMEDFDVRMDWVAWNPTRYQKPSKSDSLYSKTGSFTPGGRSKWHIDPGGRLQRDGYPVKGLNANSRLWLEDLRRRAYEINLKLWEDHQKSLLKSTRVT